MTADQLDRTFAALADPTRRSILARLAEGEATVTELAEPFAVSLPAISRRIHIDLRVGGRWELTMIRRDGGAEMAIGYEIVELVEPELLVLRSDPMPEMGMDEPTVVRVELHDHGPKTRMTLSDGPLPAPARRGAEGGWNAAVEKLAAHLGG
jgi:DNA-binding transcriptional ArsR family regulator